MAVRAFPFKSPVTHSRRPVAASAWCGCVLAVVATLIMSVPVAAEPDDVYSEKPAEAVARYLAARRQLEARTDLTVDAILARGPAVRGAVVEIAGKIAGRTTDDVCAERPLNFILRPAAARQPVYIDATADNPLVRVGSLVHVLVYLPSEAQPLDHYVMREIILSADLPDAERKDIRENGDEADVAPAGGTTAPQLPGTPSETPGGDTPKAEQALPRRPGTEFPDSQQWGTNAAVATWMQWAMGQNGDLTQMQARLIVESVLYYSYKFTIDHRLVFAMIKYESNFSPSCLSHAGAMGLTQLMPGTARYLGVSDPWDIQQNIMGGVRYLSEQLYSFEGKGKSNYEQTILGLACYNAGPNAVKRAGGVPNFTETRRYVKRVADLFLQMWQNGMP